MNTMMTIKFWGVRGSIPSPGKSTVRYGGNTSCISVDLGTNKVLVLDAGTGIREMGKALTGQNVDFFILLSHSHWDHIQGFPFFTPLYKSNWRIHTFASTKGKTMLCSLIEQMDGAHFPVTPENLPSQYDCIIDDPMEFLQDQGFNVSRIAANHPGNGYGYRIENNGYSAVYITDNELDPPYEKATEFHEFAEFCKNADILIHDAQYLEKDMPQKRGWGHSLVTQVCELALASGVKHLVLFHHDPERTDDELDAIQESARNWFKENNSKIKCTVAYEGLTLKL